MILPPYDPPRLFTVFAVDAMFYSGARGALMAAERATKGIARANKQMFKLQMKLDALKESYDNDDSPDGPSGYYDKLEPLAIQMENAEFRGPRKMSCTGGVEKGPTGRTRAARDVQLILRKGLSIVEAHGPVLRQLAPVHMLSAASLEAHVNTRADQLLSGRSHAEFARLALGAKWLFLPRLSGLKGFDVGGQPFQGFDSLIGMPSTSPAAARRLVSSTSYGDGVGSPDG